MDGLRRAHFPPERNQLSAHVTLFHALPAHVEEEVLELLGRITKAPPPLARITGLMKLGGGTAFAIESDAMVECHGMIAERMHGLLTRQDVQPARLHVTIQNKVSAQAARALQDELRPGFSLVTFRFRGLGLYAYEGGPWRQIRVLPFRGKDSG